MRDRMLASLRPSARGHAHERLLARIAVEAPIGVLAADDALCVVQQTLEPLFRPSPGATWKVVAGVLPAVDVDLAARRPSAGSEFDQSSGLAVQEPELECPMLACRQRAGEDATVREPHAARQPDLAVLPSSSGEPPAPRAVCTG